MKTPASLEKHQAALWRRSRKQRILQMGHCRNITAALAEFEGTPNGRAERNPRIPITPKHRPADAGAQVTAGAALWTDAE